MTGNELPIGMIDGPQFDYINPDNPTTSINPMKSWATWLNITSGELFICTVNTTNSNKWVGQNGTTIV